MPAGTDPLAPLAGLPGVRAAVADVQHALARLHDHPANRRDWPANAAEASVRAARASAGLDGAPLALPDSSRPDCPGAGATAGTTDGAAHGTTGGGGAGAAGAVADPVLAGALRIAGELGRLLPVWRRAPLQALARLHLLAAADLVPAADRDTLLGRPRTDDTVSARLSLLGEIVTQSSQTPGVIRCAVVHGELLALLPFSRSNGVVARAASRLTAVSTGLDPKGLAVPEVGHLRAGAQYQMAAEAFARGAPDGLAGWLLHCCDAWRMGAREGLAIAAARAV